MLNNYDLQMGLVAAGPIEIVIGALICAFVGWLLTK